jgi:hypothetical protein
MSGRGSDQRKSYRYPVDETHQAAELAVGRRPVPICLYNESAGGFAAVADVDPRVSLGDVVGLRTCGGTFEVRIAHVSRAEPAAGDDPSVPCTFRLGLERLRELASLADVQPRSHAGLWKIGGSRFLPSSAVLTAAVILLLVAAAMNGITMWCSAQTPAQAKLSSVLPEPQSASSGSTSASAETLGQIGLTPAQQIRLQKIAANAGRALQEIDAQWQRDPPEQRARKQSVLFDAVQREILQSLPAEQRAGWNTPVNQP